MKEQRGSGVDARRGTGAGKRGWGTLVLGACLAFFLSGCAGYSGLAGTSSYLPPEKAARRVARGNTGPVVLLVTGSMIVSNFYDVMKLRMEERGFRPVVYQPPDLFTKSLKFGAEEVSDAVDKVLTSLGVEKLILVAECDGGVAARRYVEKLGGDRRVSRLITFVSAHHGTEWKKTVTFPQAIVDIHPGSEYMKEMADSRMPDGGPLFISLYLCSDEIMKPYTTSRVPGALNIAVCDEAFDRRARERTPENVHDLFGNLAVRMYPIHLAVFWDEAFFNLLASCVTDEPEHIRRFRELNLVFE